MLRREILINQTPERAPKGMAEDVRRYLAQARPLGVLADDQLDGIQLQRLAGLADQVRSRPRDIPTCSSVSK